MVESINEFLKNFRERLSSPFFFSFIISWVTINWKVTIALLWYNSNLYPREGDLIRFIECNTSDWQSIYFPLLCAALYTGLVKNLVSAFVAFGVKWGGDWNLNISKGSKIPMSKFLTYRNLYIQSNKDLEKVIEDERKTIEDFDKQRQQNLKLEADNVTLTGEVARLKSDKEDLEFKRKVSDDMTLSLQSQVEKQEEYINANQNILNTYKNEKMMNGRWTFKYNNSFKGLNFEETYYIIDGVIHTVNGTKIESAYHISFFLYDAIAHKIVLHLKLIPGTAEAEYIGRLYSNPEQFNAANEREVRAYFRTKYEPVLIHELNVKGENLLTGTENIEALISYQRLN